MRMSIFFIGFFLLIAAIIFIVILLLIKNKPPVQTMLLGIEVTLLGGILAISDAIDLNGFDFFVVLFGLAITMAGLLKSKQHSQ